MSNGRLEECLATCTVKNPCTANQLLEQRVCTLECIVEKLEKNLPPWITGAAWVIGLIIGVLATLIAKGG